MKRFFTHLFYPGFMVKKYFTKEVLDSMELVIKDSETKHSGEICFAVEGSLPVDKIFQKIDSRKRALEVFSNLRIWDTEGNSGVLIYVLLAEKKIEIIADRGISSQVSQKVWDEIGESMSSYYSKGLYEKGSVNGIMQVTELLSQKFPNSSPSTKKNEISDKPVLL